MMHLGQSMLYFENEADISGVPSIFVGKNPEGDFLLLQPESEEPIVVDEDDAETKIEYVYKEDKTSPTGRSVYYGSLCKFFYADMKIIFKNKDELAAEYKAIVKNKYFKNEFITK